MRWRGSGERVRAVVGSSTTATCLRSSILTRLPPSLLPSGYKPILTSYRRPSDGGLSSQDERLPLPASERPTSIQGMEASDGLRQDGGEFEYHSSEVDLLGDPEDERWSIRCLDVHKRLGGAEVLNGLNVAIPDETITVVLGPSGTGKSVLIKHIIGLMFPDSGDIVVKGQSVPTLTLPKLLAL